MTDQQLFEICHMTNGADEGYMPSHNALFPGLSYGPSTLSALHNSPASPHFAQDALKSPITPCNDLSPLVEMPKPGGAWFNNHLSRTTSNPWMSSAQNDRKDTSNQVIQHQRMYPYAPVSLMNSEMSSKPYGGALQRLDPFNQAFPNQNLGLLRSNSLSTDNGSPNGMEDSPMLLSPQAGSPIDHALYSQSTQRFNQLQMSHGQPPQSHQPGDQITSPLLERPPSQYGYQPQQQAGHVTDAQQVYQSQHHPQHSSQGHPRPRFLSLPQHHQSHHPQLQGSYFQPNEREVQDSHPPPPSPQPLPFYYGQNCKGLEQQISYPSTTHQPSSPFQESQSYLHLPPHHNSYQPPQAQVLVDSHHSLSSKHHGLDRQNSGSLNSPTIQGLCNNPFDRVTCVDYNSSQRDSSHCCLPLHHPVTGRKKLQQSQSSTTMQWPQIVGGTGFQQDPVSPHCMPCVETTQKKASGAKLKCLVCQREFKSLPALNGHMRSHGGFKTQPATRMAMKEEPQELPPEVNSSVPMVMPVSVPVKPPSAPVRFSSTPQIPEMSGDPEDLASLYPRAVCSQQPMSPYTSTHLPPLHIPASESQRDSCEEDDSLESRPERKRVHHRLLPLFIPSPSPFPVARGAVLFRSQLRSPGYEGDVPYTPPPMLSPIRPGSGLFSSVCGVDGQSPVAVFATRVQLCKTGEHPSLNDWNVRNETPGQGTPIRIDPRINIGDCFQAKIPNLLSRTEVTKDPDNTTLVWSSWNNLDVPVDNLLRLSCCSVLPGGGTNTELALHCLFQCRGDVMVTLEKLLMLDLTRAVSQPLADYHYTGSDKWTMQERRQLNKALDKHHKDFFLVQKMVQTKTIAQCVEFYYTWKRRSRAGKRLNVGLTTPMAENEVHWEECRLALLRPNGLEKKTSTDFADCSNSLTASLGYEELSNISILDGDGETLCPAGRRCRPPVERSLPQSGQYPAPASVKSSPAHSTTSGDTDTTLAFPCRECGKVFFKVKSRNAHMKTHRQQEASLCWPVPVQRPPEDSLEMTPASPYRSPPHLLLLPSNHMSGPQGTQIEDVDSYRNEGQHLNMRVIHTN
ncbi:transcriptional-regulating factor 1 isoform X2 [Clupea harengus]|uniref:Transcriptional-regulating factor 1 isoform X2 n=1 Tax=Clupea harengus TaxID=7950 RepID=A0A6P8GEL8_CLUHA|nr:transcriptional-regulating factor 1 isoform X2 [Clupea harengus]